MGSGVGADHDPDGGRYKNRTAYRFFAGLSGRCADAASVLISLFIKEPGFCMSFDAIVPMRPPSCFSFPAQLSEGSHQDLVDHLEIKQRPPTKAVLRLTPQRHLLPTQPLLRVRHPALSAAKVVPCSANTREPCHFLLTPRGRHNGPRGFWHHRWQNSAATCPNIRKNT